MYAKAPTPPAAAKLRTYELPAVAPGTGEGAVKSISGLITRVGSEVSGSTPALFVAVARTRMYLSRWEIVGTNVAEVAPEIFVQLAKSVSSSQTFH